MDESPKCSRDQEPIPQNLTQNDQSDSQNDQPDTLKDQPHPSKDLSDTTKDQSDTQKDQPNTSKEQPVLPTNQSTIPKNETFSPKDLVVIESTDQPPAGMSFCINEVASTTLSYSRNNNFFNPYAPLIIKPSVQNVITTQPRSPRMSQLPSPESVAVRTQPQTLFLQALSKLNESSITLSVVSVINHLRLLQSNTNLSKVINFDSKSWDVSPPESLTSAPPSYSFVLRQMAVRRRPRLMGTFFPSPSFIQHTPPPTYTTAFDVYMEPAAPPPPARVYSFGFASMLIVCPECGYTGMTIVTSRVTICTHLCAIILCLLCCWVCAPLPYILRSCKDVYHYCRNCRSFVGMYCPTNPDNGYS